MKLNLRQQDLRMKKSVKFKNLENFKRRLLIDKLKLMSSVPREPSKSSSALPDYKKSRMLRSARQSLPNSRSPVSSSSLTRTTAWLSRPRRSATNSSESSLPRGKPRSRRRKWMLSARMPCTSMVRPSCLKLERMKPLPSRIASTILRRVRRPETRSRMRDRRFFALKQKRSVRWTSSIFLKDT